MANLRYARSGHKTREVERDTRTVPRASKLRVAGVGFAIAFPAVMVLVADAARPLDRSTERPMERSVEVAQPAPVVAAAVVLPAPAPAPAPVVPAPPPPPPPTSVRVAGELQPNEALSSALARNKTTADDVSSLVRSLKGHVDLRALRAGLGFELEHKVDSGALLAFELKTLSPQGVPRTILARREEAELPDGAKDASDAKFKVEVIDAPIETKIEGIHGSVRSSLYQAMLATGEEATLVDKFVDVFAWNIDFYRQTQKGDEFRVLVEKQYAGGRFLGYGKVLAAEYVNAGAVHRGFRFYSEDGKHVGTYDDEGNALQRTFLKNPMEIARLTSSYGMRFHPVLGRNKKHEGIDYGAPTGTPVWSVADGVVKEARYSKTAGNMIVIKHMNGIDTEYFHLSKFAEGLKAGARVTQKQVIGYVGNTGMSTGPHLHFGMLRGGGHVDPAKQKFPNAKPVPKEYREEFEKLVEPLAEQLKNLGRV